MAGTGPIFYYCYRTPTLPYYLVGLRAKATICCPGLPEPYNRLFKLVYLGLLLSLAVLG